MSSLSARGIAGLSAALEAARAGASVLVIDMSTVGGGHAILSNGAVCIIGTPLQEIKKIADSPALAEKDFLARGEDNDARWVAAYVRDSREWLYDWLTELGVSFESLVRPAGNSLPRLHLARGKGLGLVEPIYRACLGRPNIRFLWSTAAEDLLVREGRVTGVKVRDLRRGMRRDLNARHVIVATGGFQTNLKTVLENWPSDLPRPTRLLTGAAHSATGPPTRTSAVRSRTIFEDAECLRCHDVNKDVVRQRAGYWHYEQSHVKVLARGYACSSCHGDLFPYRPAAHRLDKSAAVTYCRACHGVQPREGQPARP
jgi:predicted oxidoreductase